MALRLILPVLIPSWRFFQTIEPSPRIEWAPHPGEDWRELRPRPRRIGAAEMLRRLFWNPDGNERLFLVSCAERIRESPTPHSLRTIEAAVR